MEKSFGYVYHHLTYRKSFNGLNSKHIFIYMVSHITINFILRMSHFSKIPNQRFQKKKQKSAKTKSDEGYFPGNCNSDKSVNNQISRGHNSARNLRENILTVFNVGDQNCLQMSQTLLQ